MQFIHCTSKVGCSMIGAVRHFCAKGIWRHRNWTIPKFPRWARLKNNDTQFVKFGGLQLLHTGTCGVVMIRISGLLTTAGHIVILFQAILFANINLKDSLEVYKMQNWPNGLCMTKYFSRIVV